MSGIYELAVVLVVVLTVVLGIYVLAVVLVVNVRNLRVGSGVGCSVG